MAPFPDAGTVRMKYELFRVCDCGDQISLGTWMFEEVNISETMFTNIEESFSFVFCESQTCHGCCEYFVAVTAVEVINATATVNNGRIAAVYESLCYSSKESFDLGSENIAIKLNYEHPKPKEILLECGQGNGGIIFREPTDPSTNIAHVVINTAGLSRPEVLVEFSSIIKFDFGIANLCLQFELFRVCDNGEPVSRGTWRFERTDSILFPVQDKAFSFIFCDSLTCPGCCEYYVTVTVLKIDRAGSQPDSFVLVNNGRMTALAQTSVDCYDHDNYESPLEKYDCINYQSNHSKPKKLLLECGSGAGSRAFTSSSDAPPFQAAHITINPTCLFKPVVNIEFSSMVSFENLTDSRADDRLQYELFKVCDNRAPISLGIWSIDRRAFFGERFDRETNTFDFTFCDCTTCPSCCDYFVTVTPVGISGTGFIATVSDGRIAALAQEG